MASPKDIREEQIRMMRLRLQADLTVYRLAHVSMSREQAHRLIEQTREQILEWFPGKGDVFDLVLRPRFLRILQKRLDDPTSRCAS